MSRLRNQPKKTMVMFFFLVFTLLLPVSTGIASPADSLEITEMDLQIWPEYDDPRVLSIYSGTIKNTSGQSFSGRISFNVPKNIQVNMACEIINGGQHSCQPYDLEDKGTYQVLTWKTTKPIAPGGEYPIWLEYYYSPLQGSPNKTMELVYTPAYKTQALTLTVKQPLDSSDYTSTPAASSKQQDTEGFTNHYYKFNNIGPEQPVKLGISYTRTEVKPSVKPADNNGNPDSTNPLGTSAWKKPEVFIPVTLFIIALAGFIIYSMYYSKTQPPTARVDRIQKKYGNTSSSKPGQKSKNGSKSNNNGNKSNNNSSEKKRIRQLLLDGKISEKTYRELIEEIDDV